MFSIAQLLVPVSAAQACGEDLSFSSELDDIAKARLHDDPTLDQGEWVVALKEADWAFVGKHSARLLESKSKDLRLAVWLAEAQAKTRHLRGLGDGFAVLAGLCEHYWDGLYPRGDDGGFEQRIGNLGWLLGRTPQLVKEMPVTEDPVCTWAEFDMARQRASAVPDPADQVWGNAAADTGMTLAELEALRRKSSAAFNQALLADARYCLATLGELERVIDGRLGADGPVFSAAREALQAAVHFLAPLGGGGAASPAAVAGMANGTGRPHGLDAADCAAGQTTGAPQERAQALAQLRQVAGFFRRTEPHSPVAYLADKAASWGDMPLHVWLRAVIKDPAAVAGLDELLGVPGD